MSFFKPFVFVSFFLALVCSSCVIKQTRTDSDGSVVDEKYIVKRPLKKFIKNVEFE